MKAKALAIEISPPSEVELGAADAGNAPWLGLSEPIEANLLALWPEDDGMPLLMISIDLLYPGRMLRKVAEDAAPGLDSSHIFFAATHTHRAPMTDDTKPLLGSPDASYMDWISRELASAVERVLDPDGAEPCRLVAGQATADHSINRRLKKKFFLARRPLINAFMNAPNKRGTTDETIIVASVENAEGEPIAFAWNYACHPVGYPKLNTVAAHFPGVVRDAIRASESSDDLPVLYFQGFSGNTRPSASARVHSVGRTIRRLLSGPLFEDMTGAAYREWAGSLSRLVLTAAANGREVSSEPLAAVRIEVEGSKFASTLQEDVSFHGVTIGRELALVAVSGEAVVEYTPLVREMSTAEFTLCVGCIDHTFGYIPTTRIIEEGGYEAGNFCRSFGLESVNPQIQEHVLAGFEQVVNGGRVNAEKGELQTP
ncbi:MAG: hypothetical protein ABWX92_10615 [Mycetocola sp.]